MPRCNNLNSRANRKHDRANLFSGTVWESTHNKATHVPPNEAVPFNDPLTIR